MMLTCRATMPLFSTFPSRLSSRIAPLGASLVVAVVTETDAQSAQRDDSASPRKPKVDMLERAVLLKSVVDSLDV